MARSPTFRPGHRVAAAATDAVASAAPVDNEFKESVNEVALGSQRVSVSSGTANGLGVEIEVDTLPSRFLPYPNGVKIRYRPYTWAEINYFSNSKVSEETTYERILEGISADGMDTGSITLMDFFFIALLRKLSSLGTPQFTLIYQAFGQQQNSVISFQDIDFEELNVPALPVRATISGIEMTFAPITIAGYSALLKNDLHRDDIAIMAMQCTSHSYDVAFDLCRSASGRDLLKLNRVDQVLYHSIKPIVCRALRVTDNPLYDPDLPESETNLPTVQERKEIKVSLDSPDTLILPFRGPDDADGDLVSFGV